MAAVHMRDETIQNEIIKKWTKHVDPFKLPESKKKESKGEESIKELFERHLHLTENDILKTLEICENDTTAAAYGLAVLSMFRSQMHFRKQFMDGLVNMVQPMLKNDDVIFFLKKKQDEIKPGEMDETES